MKKCMQSGSVESFVRSIDNSELSSFYRTNAHHIATFCETVNMRANYLPCRPNFVSLGTEAKLSLLLNVCT